MSRHSSALHSVSASTQELESLLKIILTLLVFRSLELDNACGQLAGDRDVKACCCDSSSSCNVANYTDVSVIIFTPEEQKYRELIDEESEFFFD